VRTGTNGGDSVTGGDATGSDSAIVRVRLRRGYGVAALVLVLIAAINALTVAHDAAEVGRALDWWTPWLWELSSTVYWVAMLPVFGWLATTLRPPRLRWPAAIAAHAVMTLPVSVAHVATLYTLRSLVYRLLGRAYDYGFDPPHLLYEYRKDVLAYAVLVGGAGVIGHWARAVPQTLLPPAPPPRITVRDGTRTWLLAPNEIDWAQAAGNYVELYANGTTILHRATLASIEAELAAHGFSRIHRSRLVRIAAVRTVETTRTGDFDVVLADGTRLAGSRRFRGGLSAATGTG
jgi:hypothetical protein